MAENEKAPGGARGSQTARAAKPVGVVVAICTLTGLLLGFANNLTLPLIAQNREARAWATYAALVPDAVDFAARPCDVPGVTAFMEAEEGLGYVAVAQAKGYGGQVPLAVAFAPDGTIASVAALDNAETPGLGTKIAEDAFVGQFVGRAAEPIALDDIDVVTGATISSKAALAAVNEAVGAFGAASRAGADEEGGER